MTDVPVTPTNRARTEQFWFSDSDLLHNFLTCFSGEAQFLNSRVDLENLKTIRYFLAGESEN